MKKPKPMVDATPDGTTRKDPFCPKLTGTDWNLEWKMLQDARKNADDAAFWDERSKTFRKGYAHSTYADEFIKLADPDVGDTILDMGCGNGALAIPLAKSGHPVIAADFSKGMLESLESDIAKENAEGIELPIEPILLSWTDDWREHGLGEGCVDIAIASRSIATSDLADSLFRLNAAARKKCCITLSTSSSPRSDASILEAIGLPDNIGHDFVYAIMILINSGVLPRVQYIENERHDSYEDAKDAFSNLVKMVDGALSPSDTESKRKEAYGRLKEWIGDNLVENPNAGKADDSGYVEKAFILKDPRIIRWAFISWKKSGLLPRVLS